MRSDQGRSLTLFTGTLTLQEDLLCDNAIESNDFQQYNVNDIISMSIKNDEIYKLIDECLCDIFTHFDTNTNITIDVMASTLKCISNAYKYLLNYFNNSDHEALCSVFQQIVSKIHCMQSSLENIKMIHIPVDIVSNKRQISATSLRKQPTFVKINQSPKDLIFQNPKHYTNYSQNDYNNINSTMVEETSYLKFKKNKIKHPIAACEGCGQFINFNENDNSSPIISYQVPYVGKPFYFHDQYCVNLRKYIEIIRLYCSEAQLPPNQRTKNISEYIDSLFKNINNLIRVKGNQTLPRPVKTNTKIQIDAITQQRETVCILLNKEQSGDEHSHFDDLPIEIQYCDALIYGLSLWKFIMQQILTKQIESLWVLLAYISKKIPTIKAIELLQIHISDIAKVKNINHLELVCSSIIENSHYPIATSLLFSHFITKVSDADLSRKQQLQQIADRYTIVAEKLVESVESDHLLSIYLETQTDLNMMNAFEIAIKYRMSDFFDNNRVEIIFKQMWSQFNFLNPAVKFRNTDIDLYETLTFLLYHPAQFYFTPIGRYYIQSIMYLLYVILVTIVVEQQAYLYSDLSILECFMWIANAGYALFEFMEITCHGIEYFSDSTNYFDIGIMINWIILFFIRMTTNENIYESQQDARNTRITAFYMTIFAIQIIILYCRIATIFVRNKTIGPFIRMIGGMMSDIANFAFVCLIFFFGFTFALRYVLATDVNDEECEYETDLSNYYQVSLYVFITLMGQQEWSAIDSNGKCFSEERAIIATVFIIIFSVLGTVLLLNLLIAMMSTTYEVKLDAKSKEVNFSRIEEIYQLAHRQAIIPPPLNIFVFGLSLLWYLIELCIFGLSCGKYSLNHAINMSKLVPIHVNYQTTKKRVQQNVNDKTIGLFEYKYCQFCRCEIIKNGNIDNYFALFDGYRLDEDDVKMIKNNMMDRGLCPKCFRPFKLYCDGSSNRLSKWQVIIEIVSFYVFILFLYCPLVICLCLPALLVGFWSFIQDLADNSKNSFKTMSNNNQLSVAYSHSVSSERCYKSLIRQIISEETTTELEGLENKMDKLMETMDKKNAKNDIEQKNDIDVDMKTIINTLNKQMKLLTKILNTNIKGKTEQK